MLPPRSKAADDEIEIEPLWPKLAVPVFNLMDPVTPSIPEFAVMTETEPLEAPALAPLASFTPPP
jgi:hypothetical protein